MNEWMNGRMKIIQMLNKFYLEAFIYTFEIKFQFSSFDNFSLRNSCY